MNSDLQLRWFFRLRLCAFAAQIILIALSGFYFAFSKVMLWAAALSFLIPVSLVLKPIFRKFFRNESGVTYTYLVIDTLQLTAILWLTGGATNPFSLFYLVLVALAAILLGSKGAWGVMVLSSLCFASLFLPPQPDLHVHASIGNNAYRVYTCTL